MNHLYDLSEYYGYDDNRSVEDEEGNILAILDCVFSGNVERAQEMINNEQDRVFNNLSKKYQAKCNRIYI